MFENLMMGEMPLMYCPPQSWTRAIDARAACLWDGLHRVRQVWRGVLDWSAERVRGVL